MKKKSAEMAESIPAIPAIQAMSDKGVSCEGTQKKVATVEQREEPTMVPPTRRIAILVRSNRSAGGHGFPSSSSGSGTSPFLRSKVSSPGWGNRTAKEEKEEVLRTGRSGSIKWTPGHFLDSDKLQKFCIPPGLSPGSRSLQELLDTL